jgi:hypothetical protein
MKYSFNAFVLIINTTRVRKVREHDDYNINELETSFKISLCIFVILCVEMRQNVKKNFRKITE